MLMVMMMMVNIVEHALTLVEALVLKRYWYRKKWLVRNNGISFESRENMFSISSCSCIVKFFRNNIY